MHTVPSQDSHRAFSVILNRTFRWAFFFSFLFSQGAVLRAAVVNLALNQPAVASSQNDLSTPPAFAVDGDNTSNSSRWVSDGQPYPQWIEIDLGGNYRIEGLSFWTGFDGYGFPITDFSLQTWNGTAWVDIHSVSGDANTGSFSTTFNPVLAGNRVRLQVTGGSDNFIRLYELQIMGEEVYGLQVDTVTPPAGSQLIDNTAALDIFFDNSIVAENLQGIQIIRESDSSLVGNVSASVSGNRLRIQHANLLREEDYTLIIPEGTVSLSGNASTVNGVVSYSFRVAPAAPQLLSYQDQGMDLVSPLSLTFDRTVSVVNQNGVTITDLTTDSSVSGVSVSASGTTVTVQHNDFTSQHLYRINFAPGTLEGDINQQGNDRIAVSYYAGSPEVFFADFDNGMDGFATAADLGLVSSPQSWRRETAKPGPVGDFASIRSSNQVDDDFVSSPLLNLSSGTEYTLQFARSQESELVVARSPTRDRTNVTEIGRIGSNNGSNSSATLSFTVSAATDDYLLFYTETGTYKDNYLDEISLTRSIAPGIAFIEPLDGSVFTESESIKVSADAFAVSGDLVDVKFYDDDTLLFTDTTFPYEFDWTYHVAGSRTLQVVVRDSLGVESSAEVDVTLTFDDGTLPKFIHYDFDDGDELFSLQGSIQGGAGVSGSGGIRISGKVSDGLYFSSPLIYLLQGETYTLQFDAKTDGASDAFDWKFLPTAAPGYPASISGAVPVTIQGSSWTAYELTFTVPSDGGYHLTWFHDIADGGYDKLNFDNLRLIGNFNSAPDVALLSPSAAVTTFAETNVTFEASANDSDGSIASVEFRDQVNGELIAPDAVVTSSPFVYTWTGIPEGVHQVFARAIDAQGGATDTVPVELEAVPNTFSISTLLGDGATDDAITSALYLSDGTLVLGGILTPGLFPGVTPVYLNGAASGDRGFVARLSEDGRTVLSVTVVSERVLDLAKDDMDRIFVAADAAGAVVLNANADTVLQSKNYSLRAHRIDASPGGIWAVLTSGVEDYADGKIGFTESYVYNSSYSLLGTLAGASQNTTDLAVDETTSTVVLVGWRNISAMEDDSIGGINPVDVPSMVGRAYDGTEKYRAYDWGKQDSGDRWLNRVTNNMADTRGARVIAVPEGKVYAAFEFDGGNSPLRYDPFNLDVLVPIVGGDAYNNTANSTTVPKTFIGRYDAGSGAFETGQNLTARLSSGLDNTLRIESGSIAVDDIGRVHVAGASASGLPITHDPLVGEFQGGAYHIVLSPDLSSREYVTRYTVKGLSHAVAMSPNGKVVLAGRAEFPVNYTRNAFQDDLVNIYDAFYVVGSLDSYYQFQTGTHPRLFFNASELQVIRERLDREPYASMLSALQSNRELGNFYRPTDTSDAKDILLRAQASAYLYALTGDDAMAESARSDVESALSLIGANWASPDIKGLDSYWYANKLAIVYDLCEPAPSWDTGFDFTVSKRLRDIAGMIINNGGTEQNSNLASNWQGARGAAGGLALLATDHVWPVGLMDAAESRVRNHLAANQGPQSRGWNPEGSGYTAFSIGTYIGPFAVALDALDPVRSLGNEPALGWMPWANFAGATTALDVYGLGGVKTDWTDDNAHIGGEGVYGLAFHLADPTLIPGLRHAYDRLQGALSPLGPQWDAVRHGTFWSILFYPENLPSQNPLENWDWHRASLDTGGLGMMTFRDGYVDEDDILVQFKARLRVVDGHDAPDGLGFRILGPGSPFVIGGGRNAPGRIQNQATVYAAEPGSVTSANSHLGSLVGTPLIKPDGGGHAIAEMATNNVGVANHKRWLVTDFDSATGADAVVIVADTTGNGRYWQLPTFLDNTINVNGNTFTISGVNGGSLRGTILHPGGTPAVNIAIRERGDGYTLENGGTLATEDSASNPRVIDNRVLTIDSADGDFLVVMTLVQAGSHPSVSQTGGSIANATISVGSKSYTLQADNVLYDGVAYAAPSATVTFSAGSGGTITSGQSVQTVAYGQSANAPTVTANSGIAFTGWNKSFDSVVRSMTVTAMYDTSNGTVNAAPVAVDDIGQLDQDTEILVDVLANDSDSDNDPLSIDSYSQGANGSVTQVGSQLRYVPDSAFVGTDSFSYTVTDGTDTDTANVVVTVQQISNGPSAFQQAGGPEYLVSMEAENYDALEGRNGKDWVLRNDVGTFTGTGFMRAEPDTGTLNNNNYVTNAPVMSFQVNFVTTGVHYIWIRAYNTGGNDDSLHAGLDGVGVATSDRISLSNNNNDFGWTSGTMDGVRASFDVTSTGVHELNIWMREDGARVDKIVLTTDADYTPSGQGPTESAHSGGVANNAPVANNDSITVDQDSSVSVAVLSNDTDADDDTLSISSYAQGSNGSVSQSGNNLTYTPDAGYFGSDSFSYTVSDGTDTDTATVNVTVNAVTTGSPKLNGALVSSVGDSWQTISLPETYSNPVVVATVVQTDTAATPVVARVRNVTGTAFEVKIQSASASAAGTRDLYYVVVEQGVYTAAEHGITLEAGTMTSTVTSYKNTWLNSTILTPQNTYTSPVVLGQVMSANDAGWSAFFATDGSQANPPASNSIELGKHVAEDPDTTRADETLGYIVMEAGNGTVDGVAYVAGVGADIVEGVDNTPSYSYPLSGITGVDVVALSSAAMDGADGGWPLLWGANALTDTEILLVIDEDDLSDGERAHTNEQVAYLVLATGGTQPTNTPPVANNDSTTVDQDSSVSVGVLSNDTDADGDTLSISSYAQGSNGSVSQSGNNLLYTPNAGYFGSDSFSYTVSDGTDTDTATVNVTVNEVVTPNTAPVANNDSATLDQDSSVSVAVLSNDTDADGDTLSISSYAQGSNGTVSQSGNNLTYTPNVGYFGSDSFTYTVSDGTDTDTASVSISVQAIGEGSELLNETFNSGLSGWTTSGGSWSVTNGKLVQSLNILDAKAVYDAGTDWSEYTASVEMEAREGGPDWIGMMVYYSDANNYCEFRMTSDYQGPRRELREVKNGNVTILDSDNLSYTRDTVYQVEISISNGAISVTLDGSQILSGTTTLTGGTIGLTNVYTANSTYDNIVVNGGGTVPGLTYAYYEGTGWSVLPDFSTLTPLAQET